VEEERIKSAFEIAMERISALPELTPEEIAAQKEKQFGPVGEALAGKYLSGLVNDDELQVELGKRESGQRQIIRRALISSLCRNLQLEGDLSAAGKALSGLRRIAPEKETIIGKAAEEYKSIVHEFDQEKKRQSQAIESSALRPLGISGTAVRCNSAENTHWLDELKKIRQAYEPRLETLRVSLSDELP